MQRHIFRSGLLLVLVTITNAFAAEPTTVLVDADPPLTQEKVDRCGRFFEWILDAPLTADQKQKITDELVRVWKRNDRNQMSNATAVLQQFAQVEKLDRATRDLAREENQPQFLSSWRKQPNDPMCAWAVSVYDNAHKPIAPGKPPLTRQMADASLEVLCFIASQLRGETFETSKPIKDHWAQELAKDYAGYTDAQKKMLADMPATWAAIRAAWHQLPSEKQEAYRSEWKQQFASVLPATDPPADEQADAGGQKTTDELMDVIAAEHKKLEAAAEAETDPAKKQALLMQQYQNQQNTVRMISNMSMMQHQASMAIISNIGGGGWRYEYR